MPNKIIDRLFVTHLRKILFLSSIFYSILISLNIAVNNYSHLLIILWILSIIFLVLSFSWQIKLEIPKIKLSIKLFLIIFFILLPSVIRILNYNENRLHGDEALTAYFSAKYDFAATNFFSGIPIDKAQWVAQFPSAFFILQKFFFMIFGESYLTIKLSIIPYVLIISLFLFLTTKIILNKKAAIISLVIYAFFPISLYLETLGLHFVSSTAIYSIFFYLSLLNFRKNSSFLSVLIGIFAAFNFLFYNSSFIALPMLFVVYFFQFIFLKKISILKNFLLALISFLIVLGPFLSHNIFINKYFISRIRQVSLLTGEWSTAGEQFAQGLSPQKVIFDNLKKSIQSMYESDIGGHGGYTFNNQAFFKKFTMVLFIIGIIIGIILMFRKVELLFIFLTIIFSFFTLVMSIPPPAYHRFSLSFPFIAIILALPIQALLSIKKIPLKFKSAVVVILLFIYCRNNQLYFNTSVVKENYHESIKLSDLINQNYPDRNIYIASFPGFVFEKIYYFSKNKKIKSIKTDYHDNFLNNFNQEEKYVYIYIFPQDFDVKFQKIDPNGMIIPFSSSYSLFVN